jgi:phosphatidate cytidylyltransferase
MSDEPARQGRDLVAATVVGALLLGLFVVSLVTHPLVLTGFILLLVVAALLELGTVMGGLGKPVHVDVLVVAAGVILLGTHLAGLSGLAAGLIVLVIAALLRSVADRARTDVVGTVARTVLLGAWIPGLASSAVLLRALPSASVVLLSVVGAVAVADTMAYAAGSRFGRRPIAPSVSPNKTWEGFIAGTLAAAALGALVLPLGGMHSALVGALVGAVVGFAAFLGDLVESMVKRDLGVKDLGHLLPGHGGILDRVDGLLLALPVGYGLLRVLA